MDQLDRCGHTSGDDYCRVREIVKLHLAPVLCSTRMFS